MNGFILSWTDPETQATYPDAFWTIVGGSGDLSGNYVAADIAIFADMTKAAAGAKSLKKVPYPFDATDLARQLTLDSTPRIFREVVLDAMYAMLKARPQFAGAVDA